MILWFHTWFACLNRPLLHYVLKCYRTFYFILLFLFFKNKTIDIYFMEHRKYSTLPIALKIMKDAKILSGRGLGTLKWLPEFHCFLGCCLSGILECVMDLESTIRNRNCSCLKRTVKGTHIASNWSFPPPGNKWQEENNGKSGHHNGKVGNHRSY